MTWIILLIIFASRKEDWPPLKAHHALSIILIMFSENMYEYLIIDY